MAKRSFGRSKRHRTAGIIALALAVVAFAAPSAFPAFKKVSLKELVGLADEVVMIRVVSHDQIQGAMEGVQGELPYQRLRCKILHSYKGNRKAGEIVTLHVPGGDLPGGGHFTISTAPAVETYLQGASVVFMNRESRYAPPGASGINTGDHGIYKISTRNGRQVLHGKPGSPIARHQDLVQFTNQVASIVRDAALQAATQEGRK